ncbi:MAG: hypothetical protein R2849_13805 [Thermomicrobiales bacterium]
MISTSALTGSGVALGPADTSAEADLRVAGGATLSGVAVGASTSVAVFASVERSSVTSSLSAGALIRYCRSL